jgi:hypothetical protein
MIFKYCRFQRRLVILFSCLFLILLTITLNYDVDKKFIKSQIDQLDEEPLLSHNQRLFLSSIKRDKYNISCHLILEGNKNEIEKAEKLLLENMAAPVDKNFIFTNRMCNEFRGLRGYDDHPVNAIDLEFPIAFSILTYYNVEQFERLLRVIYRPQNIYCIHIDAKSPQEFHQSIQSIVQCFDNVFIASKLEEIVYAGFSRLQADLNCMKDLLNSSYSRIDSTKQKVEWKYFLNLASTEFPLKTNYELVRILKMYNGANDIEVMKKVNKNSIKYKWIVVNGEMERTNVTKNKPPHDFTLVKGLAYGLFSYNFVDHIINNQYSKDLLTFLEDTYSPDEMYVLFDKKIPLILAFTRSLIY